MAAEVREVEMLPCDLRKFSESFPEAVARIQFRSARSVVDVVPKEDRRCPPATLLLFVCPFHYQGQQACRLVVLHNPVDWEWLQTSFAENDLRLVNIESTNSAESTITA